MEQFKYSRVCLHMFRITTLERAFEIASSGAVSDVSQLRAKLKTEGLDVSQLQGPRLLKQIRALIAGAIVRTENATPVD